MGGLLKLMAFIVIIQLAFRFIRKLLMNAVPDQKKPHGQKQRAQTNSYKQQQSHSDVVDAEFTVISEE